MFPRDFKELLSVFNSHGVRYLLVGGYAVSLHAQPRATEARVAGPEWPRVRPDSRAAGTDGKHLSMADAWAVYDRPYDDNRVEFLEASTFTMPVHEFEFPNREYFDRWLRDGGPFWEALTHLPIESGHTFSFVPENCPKEWAGQIEKAVLGGFDDTTYCREEEEFVVRHLRGSRGNAVIFGVNRSSRRVRTMDPRFQLLATGPSSTGINDGMVVLCGGAVTPDDVREALIIAESPFVCAALLETQEEEPVEWIRANLGEGTPGALPARTVGLIVEAYRGEGLLFWSASPVARCAGSAGQTSD